ncbi:MAG: hypothetical protein JKX73_04480 [Flavobacteriales bacterium]|nr:hypothetical protein [Flavobacteriales bacterium]
MVPFVPPSSALDDYSEDALIKEANELFEDGMYSNAFPLFSQLLSLYPDNIDYNYKFSVCMLFADEEKTKSIQYLEKVTKNENATKEAFFYLGYAYHLNYQFRKAITAYNTFRTTASKKTVSEYPVIRKIQMCENGLTLLRTKSALGVISKTEIKETEYFRTYDMELLTGKILVKPDDFKTSTDKDRGEESLVYAGKNAKMIFYSSYGNGDNRDLYMLIKKPGGTWGTAQRLPEYINSPYDENFPVMHPDQNVIYFSSKGHNSMGGYDIFKAKYDSVKGKWSKPVNLDFPINSADDDILYLPTRDERTAFFSSNRSSVQGKITVYKIMLKEAPGRFTDQGEPVVASTSTPQPEMEEILATASLDVNAKEEDFAAPTEEATTSSSQPSESIKAETFTNLTDEQLVDVGFEYAENIKKDEERLAQEADVSFEVARAKKQQATAKKNEAAAIKSRLDNISDPGQKEVASQKAEILEDQAVKLEKEAELAFEFAKTLTSEAEVRKQQSATATANAEKIKTAMANNQKDESISILIDQKVMAQSIESSPSGVAQKSKEKEIEAKVKEAEAGESYEKIQFMESEVIEIDNDIKTLLEQADRTKDAVIKEEILAQAQELEAEKQDTETELAATYTEAEKLNREAKDLREEADLLSGVSDEILASSSYTPSSSSSSESSELVSIEPASTTEETTAEEAPLPVTEPDPIVETTSSTDPVAQEDFDITPESISEAITDDNIVEEMIAVEELENDADEYEDEAKTIREKAETADPAFRENALREAEKFEEAAAKKRTAASSSKAMINTYTFKTNVSQYDELETNNKYLTPEDLEEVKSDRNESASKFVQAQELRTAAETVDDPADKAATLREAEKLEVEAIAGQEEIYNSLSYKENKGEIAQKNKDIGSMESASVQEIGKYNEESDNLYTQARGLRKNAATIDDPKQKAKAYKKADALEKQALEKQQTALNLHELYKYEGVLFEAVKTARPLPEEEKASLDVLETEYTALAEEAKTVRSNAETSDDPDEIVSELHRANELEQQAIEKQRTALNIYFESDEEVAELLGEDPPVEARVAPNSSSEPSSTTSEPLVSVSTTTSTSSADDIPDTDPRTAAELVADSEAKRAEAELLYASVEELTEDPDVLMANIDRAEKLEAQADAEMARAKKLDSGNGTVVTEAETASGQNTSSVEPINETTSTSTGSVESTSSNTGDLEDATADEILAAVMNEEPGTFTSTEPETATTSSSSEEEFSISETGESNIEYVENTATEPETYYTAESSSGTLARENISMLSEDEPLAADIFAVADMISYTPANPIPVNPVIPSGLLFKVQIGAFKNPIPQNLFKGINPIMGEKTGMGFIRYSAGLFRALSSANEAKGVIRGLGYNDAFVVAFYNGERVSMAGARLMLEDGTVPQPVASSGSSSSSTSSATSGSSTGSSSSSVSGTTDISSIADLFYTVQVGVYSKPSNVGEKFNLNDLYTVRTSNGYIRYNEGRFTNSSDANNRKEGVVDNGITDAFVVAYYNGQRISLTQARTMGTAPITNTPTPEPDPVIDETPEPEPEPVQPVETETAEPETEVPIEIAIEPEPVISIDTDEKLDEGESSDFSVVTPADEIVYMIKIGQFAKDVPVDEASTFLEIKDLGIEVHSIGDTSYYTVGEFIRYEEAEMLRLEVEIRGIEYPSIVVFYEERIMSVEDYLRKTLR